MENIKKVLLATLIITSGHVHSGGFEKVTMWSAKWSALAAAATAGVNDSTALYFNPAGLIRAQQNDISLNISPGFSQFKGPAITDDEIIEGERVLTTPFGITSNWKLSDQFSVGFGVYVSAGTKSNFENLNFSSISSNYDTLRPNQQSSLSVVETGLGAAYKLSKNWSIGVTWRLSAVNAEMSSAKAVPNVALINVHLKDLNDINYASVRLGTQFLSDSKNWGLGLAYRSKINFSADGKSSGQYQKGLFYGGAAGDTGSLIGGGDVTISSQLPQQLSLGTFAKVSSKFTLFSELTWTDYSQLGKLELSGESLTLPSIPTNLIQDITQDWQDQLNVKIAGEYQFPTWAVRAGYAFTSQVTPDNYARITFSSPGAAHSIVTGAGRAWDQGKLVTNFALEYSIASGDGESEDGISGKYSVDIFVAHLSCKYLF